MNTQPPSTADSPGLTLVHGWAMHSGLFQPLVDELQQVACTPLDLPGHGQNRNQTWPEEPDALPTWLAESAQGGWLLGWSLGGLLAMEAALAHPERIRGLVLVAATPCFLSRPHWPQGVAPALLAQLADELESAPETVLNRFLALEVHGSENAADHLRTLRREAFRHGLPESGALTRGLEQLRRSDLSGRLASLDLPVLVIGGRRDRLVTRQALEETVQRLPRARLVEVPGAAHAPFLSHPRAVAAAIEEFLHVS